jgi:hypothetical protein
MGVVRRKARRYFRQHVRRVAVTCGTCGKRYTNPLTHTCTVRTDWKRRVDAAKRRRAAEEKRRKARERRDAARARRREAAARRRAAAAAKRKGAAKPKAPPRPAAPQHRYQACKDEYCEKFPCRVYREGYRNGYDDGYGQGYGEGYTTGFAEGLASCPGPHGGG